MSGTDVHFAAYATPTRCPVLTSATLLPGEVRRDVWRLLGGSFEEFMWGPGEQGLGRGLVQ
eukprot:3493526-Rhodomonas_salina.1